MTNMQLDQAQAQAQARFPETTQGQVQVQDEQKMRLQLDSKKTRREALAQKISALALRASQINARTLVKQQALQVRRLAAQAQSKAQVLRAQAQAKVTQQAVRRQKEIEQDQKDYLQMQEQYKTKLARQTVRQEHRKRDSDLQEQVRQRMLGEQDMAQTDRRGRVQADKARSVQRRAAQSAERMEFEQTRAEQARSLMAEALQMKGQRIAFSPQQVNTFMSNVLWDLNIAVLMMRGDVKEVSPEFISNPKPFNIQVDNLMRMAREPEDVYLMAQIISSYMCLKLMDSCKNSSDGNKILRNQFVKDVDASIKSFKKYHNYNSEGWE